MDNPKSEYLRILYKINEIYTRHLPNEKYDLLNEIEHYSSKNNLTQNDLINLQNFCLNEWNKALKKLCALLIKKINSKSKFKEVLKIELKECEKINIKLENNCIEVSEYEQIYDEDLESLKDKVEVKFSIEKFERRKFWIALILGLLFGIIASILAAVLWGYFGW